MADPTEKIVITPAELADKRVDETLAAWQSFGMAAMGPPPVPDVRTSLVFRGWFLVMVAGALGGLCAWAVIEPFFSDYVNFRGVLHSVEAEEDPGAGVLKLDVSGAPVVLSVFTMVTVDGTSAPFTSLELGQTLDVRGELSERNTRFDAVQIDVVPDAVASDTPVDLSALALRDTLIGLSAIPIVTAFIGGFVGAADGFVSRARHRALLTGVIGLGVGLGLGLVAGLGAEVLYGIGQTVVLPRIAGEAGVTTTVGFLVQVMVRGLAWCAAGAAAGVGQGIAFRSTRLLVNGIMGGAVGGLLGGLLFDPSTVAVQALWSDPYGDVWVSRALGFTVIGLCTGLMIGVVELLAREAWVKLLTGPLAGKEFVLYRNPTRAGSSPKSEIYLFKDPAVEPTHGLIHSVGEDWEIEDQHTASGTMVNGRRIRRHRLRHGDQVRLGKTVFAFHSKEG